MKLNIETEILAELKLISAQNAELIEQFKGLRSEISSAALLCADTVNGKIIEYLEWRRETEEKKAEEGSKRAEAAMEETRKQMQSIRSQI